MKPHLKRKLGRKSTGRKRTFFPTFAYPKTNGMRILFVSLLGLWLWNCSGGNTTQEGSESGPSPEQQAEEQLWDEVMAVHDDVMPEMADINRLTKQMDELLQNQKLSDLDRAQVIETMQEIDKAGEGMWNWMAGLKQLEPLRAEGKSHEEIMAYLREQKTEIEQVRDAMRSSISEGKALLDQIKN